MKKHAKEVYYNNIEDVISESHTHNPNYTGSYLSSW